MAVTCDDVRVRLWSKKAMKWLKEHRGWLVPAFGNGCCLFTSMWLLHCATYFYVLQMTQTERNVALKASATQMSGPFGSLSPGLEKQDVSYGSLEDPLEGWLGFKEVSMGTLDKVSATLPAIWFILCIWMKDLQMWTKVCICNAFLGLLKGIFGIMTIVPDSSGWQNCKERLGPTNIAWLENEVPDPFTKGYAKTFSSILLMQFTGINHESLGTGMRYCADMMFSGHTYFTCLYALALVELVRRALLEHHKKLGIRYWQSRIIVWCVMLACLAEQIIEVTLVLEDRFHYTSDVAMAIVITLLFYTNGPVAIASKHWVGWVEAQKPQLRKTWRGATTSCGNITAKDHHVRLEGDLWIPLCCFPFCSISGYHHLVSTVDLAAMSDDQLVKDLCTENRTTAEFKPPLLQQLL